MIKVGTAGAPISSKKQTTFDGIERIKELGLDAMEIEFTHGVRMGKETAKKLGEHNKSLGIALSVHGPYYINLNSKEAKKIKDSEQRILDSAERGHLMGARNIVFHPGFYSGKKPEEAYDIMRQEMEDLVQVVEERGWNVRLCPETTGKLRQFGNWKELINLCKDVDGLGMTFDWAHVWAREKGKVNFDDVFKTIKKELGSKFLKDMHMHFSGIEWNKGGEWHHLNLNESKVPVKEWVRVMKKYKIAGTLICESPNLETDALKMKKLLS
ncbi:MAG: TIM barrel protein [Candidatus Diapherotrites archaeon]|nr:TIM barrel protein [Candidatus Diapherotrites archaeon]